MPTLDEHNDQSSPHWMKNHKVINAYNFTPTNSVQKGTEKSHQGGLKIRFNDSALSNMLGSAL